MSQLLPGHGQATALGVLTLGGTHTRRWDKSLYFPQTCFSLEKEKTSQQNGLSVLPATCSCSRALRQGPWAQPPPAVSRTLPLKPVSDAQWPFLSSLPRQAWDLAVDICLSQLPTIIEEGTAFRVSPSGVPAWVALGAASLGTWAAKRLSGGAPRTRGYLTALSQKF